MPPDPTAAQRYAQMTREMAAQQAARQPVVVAGGQDEPILPASHLTVYSPGGGTEGFAFKDEKGRVALRDKSGARVMVPEAEAQAYVDKGYMPIDVADYYATREHESIQASQGEAGMGAFSSGISFGATDAIQAWGRPDPHRLRTRVPGNLSLAKVVALGPLAAMEHGQLFDPRAGHKRARELREAHPYTSELSEAAGMVTGVALGGLGAAGRAAGARRAARLATQETARRAAAMRRVAASMRTDSTAVLEAFGRRPVTPAEAAAREAMVRRMRMVEGVPGRPSVPIEAAPPGRGAVDPLQTNTRAQLTFRYSGWTEPVAPVEPLSPAQHRWSEVLRSERAMGRTWTGVGEAEGQLTLEAAREGGVQLALADQPVSLGRRVMRTMGRGALEGATYSAGRELSRQALSEQRELDIAAIATDALEGAAVGGALALAGAGLGSVASKVGGRVRAKIQDAAFRRVNLSKEPLERRMLMEGMSSTRLEALLGQQRAIVERLKFVSNPMERKALQSALKAQQAAVQEARIAVFQAAGAAFSKLRGPIGLAPLLYGFNIQNLLLGLAAQGVSQVLRTRVAAKVGSAVVGGTGRAIASALPAAGKLTRVAMVDNITDSDAEALASQLEITNPEDVGLAAAKGFELAGVDAGMAGFLADFQRKRVELLQQVVMRRPDSTARVAASRVLNAVEDPRRIIARLTQGQVWGEDLIVLQYLFPEVYKDLQRQAAVLVNRPGLSARVRLDLLKLAGAPQLGKFTQAVQQAMQPQPQPGQGGRRFNPARDAQTETQRLQAGGKQ